VQKPNPGHHPMKEAPCSARPGMTWQCMLRSNKPLVNDMTCIIQSNEPPVDDVARIIQSPHAPCLLRGLLRHLALEGFHLLLRAWREQSHAHRPQAGSARYRSPPHTMMKYDKMCQSDASKSKSKKHGPITGSNLGRNGLIRACDWSMLSGCVFSL
jgi:hypothetical protein